jgi:hypothetical protein
MMAQRKTPSDKVDLESEICDVADMANVCVMLTEVLERNERSTAELEITAKQAAEHLAYWRDAASFAVLHLKIMTTALKKQYYASTEE